MDEVTVKKKKPRLNRDTEKPTITRCSICNHAKRQDIDKAVLQPGATIRGTARQYAVSEDALIRHVKNGHITTKIAKVAAIQEAVEAHDLLNELNSVVTVTEEIITAAREMTITTKDGEKIKTPNYWLALKGIEARHKQIDIKAKIAGIYREKVEHSGIDEKPVIVKVLKGEASLDDL